MLLVIAKRLPIVAVLAVICWLAIYLVSIYMRTYDPTLGRTKLICFGEFFASWSIQSLKDTPHLIRGNNSYGYDGQFYAQLALDPSLRDPALGHALDLPIYRARRIALPAFA